MKKFWILAAICTLLVGCRESLEDRCAREAKEYTEKNCPTRMDKNIILDSMAFERDTHTLHYYYTLTGFADRDGVMEEVDARGALKEETPSARVAHRYWTYSLWLVAGVTLLALLAYNVVLFQLDVMHVFISVLFALLSSVALLMVLKSVLGSKSPRLMKAFKPLTLQSSIHLV